jgi:hypothetical protein
MCDVGREEQLVFENHACRKPYVTRLEELICNPVMFCLIPIIWSQDGAGGKVITRTCLYIRSGPQAIELP